MREEGIRMRMEEERDRKRDKVRREIDIIEIVRCDRREKDRMREKKQLE